MFEFLDIEQNGKQWYQERAGRFTSSNAGKVMATPYEYIVLSINKSEGFAIANNKTKTVLRPRYDTKIDAENALSIMRKKDLTRSFGEPAKQYAVNIAIEQITGQPIESTYTNEHMERGHEQEPIARMMYEDRMFCTVTNGGFFKSDFVGCSPDGLVSSEGLIEIKSVVSHVHYENIKRQNVDPAYRWQCIGNLKFTNREWIDFVSYCADFPPEHKLFIYRLHKKDLAEEFAMIDNRLDEFKRYVDSVKKIILEEWRPII